jgi:hypothetical protein
MSEPDAVSALIPDRAQLEAATQQVQRLLARGTTVKLADGREARLQFKSRSLARIELQYGSIDAYLAKLRESMTGQLFHHVCWTLQLLLDVSEDEAWELFDSRRVGEYMAAISRALVEALPAEDEGGNPPRPPANGSPGSSTTTLLSPAGGSTRSASGT